MDLSTALQWTYILLPTTSSIAVAGTCAFLLIKHYKRALQGIGASAKAINNNYQGMVTFAREKLLTRGAFFRYAILVCMSMSVVHGSHLFTTKNNIDGLDLALAATFDIGTWVLMEAMISTRKRGYLGASLGILCCIIIVSGISFLANIAFNTHFYDATAFSGFDLSKLGISTKAVIVMAQSSPPLIIILMTLVAETFIKADIVEEVTYAQRIWTRYQRQIDREAARLKLIDERAKLQQQYSQAAKTRASKTPLAWSFLGIIKVYQTAAPADLPATQVTQFESPTGGLLTQSAESLSQPVESTQNTESLSQPVESTTPVESTQNTESLSQPVESTTPVESTQNTESLSQPVESTSKSKAVKTSNQQETQLIYQLMKENPELSSHKLAILAKMSQSKVSRIMRTIKVESATPVESTQNTESLSQPVESTTPVESTQNTESLSQPVESATPVESTQNTESLSQPVESTSRVKERTTDEMLAIR